MSPCLQLPHPILLRPRYYDHHSDSHEPHGAIFSTASPAVDAPGLVARHQTVGSDEVEVETADVVRGAVVRPLQTRVELGLALARYSERQTEGGTF